MTVYRYTEGKDQGRNAEEPLGKTDRVRYRFLNDPDLAQELKTKSNAAHYNLSSGDIAHGASIQPCSQHATEDRYTVSQCALSSGAVWTFAAVLDGHGGSATVDFAVEELPTRIQAALQDLHSKRDAPSHNDVVNMIRETILALDNEIGADLQALFPKGTSNLSNVQIRAVLESSSSGVPNIEKLHRGFSGCAIALALLDPHHKHLYVASLGDCFAVLCAGEPHGEWKTELLTKFHTCYEEEEVKRITSEHPGEPYCVRDGRLLGALGMTRALGDWHYKLPADFSSHIYRYHNPSTNILIPIMFSRNRTPPYLSARPSLNHVKVRHFTRKPKTSKTFLILASDGLLDMYGSTTAEQALARMAAAVAARGEQHESNPAVRILRDALGGQDNDLVSRQLTLEQDTPWLDDITVLVQPI